LSNGILSAIFNLLPDFYRFREYLFLYVLLFYLSQYRWGREKTDYLSRIIVRGICVFLVILVFLWRTQPPLNEIIGYWGWISPVEWVAFILISYHTLHRKTLNPTLSLIMTGIATNASGYIYELPYFVMDYLNGHRPFIFAILKVNSNNTLLLSSQIVSIFLLMLFLKYETDFKPNSIMLVGLSTMLMGYVFYRYLNYYFVRIPTMFFILTLWSGVSEDKKCG